MILPSWDALSWLLVQSRPHPRSCGLSSSWKSVLVADASAYGCIKLVCVCQCVCVCVYVFSHFLSLNSMFYLHFGGHIDRHTSTDTMTIHKWSYRFLFIYLYYSTLYVYTYIHTIPYQYHTMQIQMQIPIQYQTSQYNTLHVYIHIVPTYLHTYIPNNPPTYLLTYDYVCMFIYTAHKCPTRQRLL